MTNWQIGGSIAVIVFLAIAIWALGRTKPDTDQPSSRYPASHVKMLDVPADKEQNT